MEYLAPKGWKDAWIQRHIDEYTLDCTLRATNGSPDQVPDTGVFQLLNLSG